MRKNHQTLREQREEVIVRSAIRKAIQISLTEAKESSSEKPRKNSMMTDVSGEHLQQIADELGFSVSGAKQAVDKAMKKAIYLQKMDDEERNLLVLQATKDYIEYLEKSVDDEDEDAPSQEDIDLMYQNPEMVADLDGFREFLHKYVRRHAKASGEKIS